MFRRLLFVLPLLGCAASAADDDAAVAGGGGLAQAVDAIKLDAPYVAQKPELPRGCEVTSLTMLLRYAGITVDKMTLAAEIDKVPFEQNGYRGNPSDGFVGDMYTFSKPGFGAYHAPVARLAQAYFPGRIVDLTGRGFDDLLTNQVGSRHPVWVIINATFAKLPPSAFETWKTTSGNIQITWHEHSVLVTGYDARTVFINDPLDPTPNKALDRQAFREAWEQMGKQAITFTGPPVDPISNSTGTCAVKSDRKLHCTNRVTPVYAGTSLGSEIVDTLRTTNSWFSCWVKGEAQPNGNTTWYRTSGDDAGRDGMVPGSALDTRRTFDVDPSKAGLPGCGWFAP